MRYSFAAAAAALVASVVAMPALEQAHGHAHQHRNHARDAASEANMNAEVEERAVGDVVIATIDGQRVSWINEYNGQPTSAPAAAAAAPTAAVAPAPSSWSAPESSAPAKNNLVAALPSASTPSASPASASPPSVSLPAYGSSPSASPGSSSGSSSSGSGQGSISANGNKWAMTYTPYNNDGSCKSASDVASDIASIKGKGFSAVRIYATDCSGPQNVGSACKANGLKLILGIYIDGSGISDKAYAQVSTLTSWGSGQWDLVEMVVVGNEAIFNGYATASALASFITDVKGKFKSAGYSGPVTTTEPLGTIQENKGTLCPVVDVIAANIHPFFNTAISAAKAGDFVSSQLGDLAKACDNQKEAYNLETGWPWKGNGNGAALPGIAAQVLAINSIIQSAGAKSVIFSFENDGWKAPGALDVEQYWGCGNLF